ncbi:hypothetical protein Pth03_46550 [Planotetraspora thailandica]|uniref:Uncharacterized protein n=1 Tax=Planotetraspora thailandica TaxID=487172 RepID=A0A8J3V7C2_9ACTN|nr:hypothetical protein Pth03_46550 [Planotetraspora thailandica]
MLTAEGMVETALADAERVHEVLWCGGAVPLAPEHLHGLLDGHIRIELLGPSHMDDATIFLTWRYINGCPPTGRTRTQATQPRAHLPSRTSLLGSDKAAIRTLTDKA